MNFPKTSKKARKWQNFFDRRKDEVTGDIRDSFEKARDACADIAESAELEIEARTSPALVLTIGACFGFIFGVAVTVWVL